MEPPGKDFSAALVFLGVAGMRDRALDGARFDFSSIKFWNRSGELDAMVSLP
ncbi:hypothetical protein ACFIOY_19205 [Bradyrhizobium sp. TZ2]